MDLNQKLADFKIAAIVTNYNGGKDTISCIESLLRSELPLRWIFVIDNNSPDNSIELIKKWAAGEY